MTGRWEPAELFRRAGQPVYPRGRRGQAELCARRNKQAKDGWVGGVSVMDGVGLLE